MSNIDIIREYEDSVQALTSRIRDRQPRLLQTIWDIAKKGSLTGIGLETLNQLFRQDLESQKLRRLEGFYDLWSSSLKVRDYANSLERVFGPIRSDETDVHLNAARVLEEMVSPKR